MILFYPANHKKAGTAVEPIPHFGSFIQLAEIKCTIVLQI